jgi:hypothetical protein
MEADFSLMLANNRGKRLGETWLGRAMKEETCKKSSRFGHIHESGSSRYLVNFGNLAKTFNESQITSVLELFVENCQADLEELQKLLAACDYTNFERKL